MSVTLIAEKAGVSVATVSRVLNKSRPVQPEIADRVMRAVAELKIPPQRIRRRSKASFNKPLTIAIVSLGNYRNWFEVPVISNMMANLSRAAQAQNVGVLITEMPDPYKVSPALRRADVEGALVFVDGRLSPADVEPLRQHLPIVRVMGGHLVPMEVDHVTTDNCAIGHLAGEYLLRQGITELAFLTTSPDWQIAQLRAQGFLNVARNAGKIPKVFLQAAAGTIHCAYGPTPIEDDNLPSLVRKMLSMRTGRLGICVSRDQETVAVYQLFRDAGLDIGRDVRVISCDNETVRLSTLFPRPLSIDLSAGEIARLALDLLIKRIHDPERPFTRTLVSPKLVENHPEAVAPRF